VGILSTLPGGTHFELDGTSMAAPHVSGAAAVLRSISPGLTVDEVEAAISDGAIDFGAAGPDNEFGAGRLDLLQSASLVLGMPLVGIGATTPNAYEAGLVPGRFTITRKGDTTSDLVVAYTISGTATPGSDYVALPGSVTIPAGAASATIVVTPIDDAEVELTETVIVTLTPNPAYLASPSQATVNVVSDEIPPDLVVTALTAPPNGGAGAPLAISDTTRNQAAPGSVAAAPSATVFYLSTDFQLDASDVQLGSRAVPALAAGASSSGTTTVTLPATLAAGRYYILAKADGNDLLVEAQEANNVTYTTVLVGADLQVSDLVAPTDSGAGISLTLTDTTRNAGSGAAIATTTSFYLSTDGTLDAGDVLLGSRAVPALAPGATNTGSTTVTLPAGTATGAYTLFARADSGDAVVETFENNNTRSATLRVGPDLTMTTFTAPATAGIGTSFSVSDTTRNAGGGTAPASTTSFYLSANGTLDASDILLGSRAVPALAPGASSSGSATLTIPASTPGGSYFLIAAADGDGAIAETSETNNIVNRGITVGADLHILTFSAPSDAGAGLTVTLTDTTRNQGAGTAAASTTSFYLSVDATLDAGDVLLGSRAVPALAGGASSAGSTTVTIPAGTATGTYNVIARADSGDVVPEAAENNNTSYRTLRVGPDLQVSALTAPASAGAGSSITVSVTTLNAGAGGAAASSTRIYLSTDWLLDAGDVQIASRAVPALGPGASDVGSVTATIPAATAGGAYYLIAVADGDGVVAETQEGNNTLNRSLLIGPDLTLAALTVPSDAGAGLAITVTDTTRNNGGGTAPASTTSFYLSMDGTLDVGDVLLGSRAVASLVAGAQDTGSVALTIPPGTATGTYTLIARADALDAVAETYENNNTTGRTIRIGPDLQMQALTVPASAGAGTTISISDSVRNAGGGGAPASTTRYYLSADSLPGGGDVLLGSRVVAALAPGASDAATLSVTIPAGTAGGSYYIVAVADDDGVVPETIESNNFTNRSILIGTDLVVTSFTAPADGGAGLALTLTDTTRNQGAGTSAPTTTGYYLSANSTLDGGDTLLGSRAVPALAAGASDTGSASVTLPAGLAVGTYYLIARADSGDAAAEVNESNNTSTRTIRVGPDLTIASITAPTTAGAGSAITVTETTQNLGGGTAPASTTYYYLSADWLYSVDDVLLGSRSVPSLAPGATSATSVSLTIPAGTPGGTRYLIAVADGDATIVETVEANNATYRSILIGADLQVSSFTVPAIGGAGLALTITDTTRNAGGGTAAASTTSYYLSADFTLDASDVLLGSRAVPSLAPGASDTGSVTVTIPAGTATGTYTVFARADAGALISETYENNNINSSTLKVGPDLSVSSLSAPIGASAGASFAVTETTRNAGGGDAAASTTRYLLSSNGLPDAGDIVLGVRAVPALGPGTTDTATVSLTIPPGTANGSYYLIAVSDADGVVAETVETNNFANRGFTVGP
jgi:subtilase family serine protease